MDNFDFLFKKVHSLSRICFLRCCKLACAANCFPCPIYKQIKDIEKKLDEIVKNEVI